MSYQVELQKNESTIFTSHSCFSAVPSYRDPPQHYDSEHPCVLFTAAEAPAADKEGMLWPFDPKDEPVASFDSNVLFRAFGGVEGDETDYLAFIVREEPIKGTGLPNRVTVIRLVTMIQYAAMAASRWS